MRAYHTVQNRSCKVIYRKEEERRNYMYETKRNARKES